MGRKTVFAFRLLQIALVALLVGAGADKIFRPSPEWDQYLPAFVPWLLGVEPVRAVAFLGVVELAFAGGLAWSPRSFGPLLSLWFLLGSFLLVLGGKFVGLGLLNLALAILAFAEGCLAAAPAVRPRRSLRLAARYPRSLAAR